MAVTRRLLLLIVAVAAAAGGRPDIAAQVRPVYDTGAAGLAHVLGRLQTTASALHVGAHPDDEDSAFIARLARGDHARVAYLSLTRGEGGQNVLGSELFDALGVIRTEELLQARRLDGGDQFFTRAIDFGFSKTLAETRARWTEHEILGDAVRVIRTYRPLVVYARFTGTPADGHGQHQFAGDITPKAFAAAADPAQFPEQLQDGLRPWQARKLYRGGRGGGPASAPTLQIATGRVDPVVGRSYAAIAAEGRSQHRSQEMGGIEPLGPNSTGLRLVESRVPTTERSIFDGVDITLTGLVSLVGLPPGTASAELAALDDAARRALGEYRAFEPERLVPILVDGLRQTRRAREAIMRAAGTPDARGDADFLLAIKEADFSEALAMAAGLRLDPLAADETITPGDTLDVDVRLFIEHPNLVRVTQTTLGAPEGWAVAQTGIPSDGGFRRETPAQGTRHRVSVPVDAPLTQPYFLRQARKGDLYEWPTRSPRGRPFDEPLLTARVTAEIAGESITLSRPVEYRTADPVRGEIRRSVHVVPRIAVGLDSTQLVVPTGGEARPIRVVARATSFARGPQSGTVRLRLPDGWASTPSSWPIALASRGDAWSATFAVTPPARRSAGSAVIEAVASVDGRTFAQDVETIAYPHIQTHRVLVPAAATAQMLDIAVAPVRVGYIMGSGDDVPAALARIGLSTTLLDADALATGDLSQFDTIVVGIRASEARPDFVAHQGRLREYMERGGTLIVQYQQTDYVQRGLPPYPVQAGGNSRVTDETAPVRILVPNHPVFTFPNRITPGDFDGWVQERNLYAFPAVGAPYVPLLESADAGEPPQRGGQVYGEVGSGRYIYTSYAWFRQLRAGVPGAYRLFANLVSLPRAP